MTFVTRCYLYHLFEGSVEIRAVSNISKLNMNSLLFTLKELNPKALDEIQGYVQKLNKTL